MCRGLICFALLLITLTLCPVFSDSQPESGTCSSGSGSCPDQEERIEDLLPDRREGLEAMSKEELKSEAEKLGIAAGAISQFVDDKMPKEVFIELVVQTVRVHSHVSHSSAICRSVCTIPQYFSLCMLACVWFCCIETILGGRSASRLAGNKSRAIACLCPFLCTDISRLPLLVLSKACQSSTCCLTCTDTRLVPGEVVNDKCKLL